MKFAFDPDKNAVNLAKHGVSLSEAQYLDWNTLLAKEDNRSDYCEQRMIGYAVMGVRLYCVVYTDRKECRRIISLRKANKREVYRYANND